MGFVVLFLDWLKSYLAYRERYVTVNNTCSKKLKLSTGVPHGSILGPLLFILFINDISDCNRGIKLHLFADDTNILLSNEDINSLIIRANSMIWGLQLKQKFIILRDRCPFTRLQVMMIYYQFACEVSHSYHY